MWSLCSLKLQIYQNKQNSHRTSINSNNKKWKAHSMNCTPANVLSAQCVHVHYTICGVHYTMCGVHYTMCGVCTTVTTLSHCCTTATLLDPRPCVLASLLTKDYFCGSKWDDKGGDASDHAEKYTIMAKDSWQQQMWVGPHGFRISSSS